MPSYHNIPLLLTPYHTSKPPSKQQRSTISHKWRSKPFHQIKSSSLDIKETCQSVHHIICNGFSSGDFCFLSFRDGVNKSRERKQSHASFTWRLGLPWRWFGGIKQNDGQDGLALDNALDTVYTREPSHGLIARHATVIICTGFFNLLIWKAVSY